MKNLILIIIFCAFYSISYAEKKVACIGNSVTYGYLLKNREYNAYPAQLQRLLGNRYKVGNFGHSGATLLNKGHRPYMKLPEFQQALAFNPDIVIIHLGLNDTDPRNWPQFQDEFITDYTALIDSFRTVNPKVELYVCRMSPIFHWHPRFQSGTRDWYWQIQKAIARVAKNNNAELIDLQEVLYDKPCLMPDALHPNEEGAALLAKRVCEAITGDYGGLKMSTLYSDNMVLQRRDILRINGKANKNEKIKVRFAGKTQTTKADAAGNWAIAFAPMEAGGPYTLSIESPQTKLTYNNVAIGEVWVCSGQSNMYFRVNQCREKELLIQHASLNPDIRIFDMKPRCETNAVEWDSVLLNELNQLNYFQTEGWRPATATSIQNTSAIAYAFARVLCDSLQIPIGIIHNSVGGSPTEAWIDRKTLEFEMPQILSDWKQNDHIQQWVRQRGSLNIKKAVNPLQRHPYQPAYLYESAIKPLVSYPIGGVIWYQGESNAHNTELHEQLFPLLIDSWRMGWNKEMPFYYVQLSSLNRPGWPLFRDSQRRLMQSRPALGMAVSSDRGDSLDVHPTRKKEIGERLAAWALAKSYNKNVTPSGPLFRNAEFRKREVLISFDYANGLTTSDHKMPACFEVADESGIYYPADARIENDQVYVSSKKVKNPRYVRYGWQPFTRANLINKAGYPASTFEKSQPVVLAPLPIGNNDSVKGVSAPFAAFVNGRIVVGGGCNFPDLPAAEGGKKQYYSDIYTYDAKSDEWHSIGHLPTSLAYGASVVNGNEWICIGGMNNSRASGLVYTIRIDQDQCIIDTLPSLPVLIDNFAAIKSGRRIYVAGGNINGKPENALFAFDLQTRKQWIRLANFPNEARLQPQLLRGLNDTLLLLGGFQAGNLKDAPVLSDKVLAYDPQTNRWTDKSTLPHIPVGPQSLASVGGFGVNINDSILVIGGGVNRSVFQEALDVDRQISLAKANEDTARVTQLCHAKANYLKHPVSWYRFNDHIYRYHLKTNQWEVIATTSQAARAGAGAIYANGNLYVIGGELMPGIRTDEVTAIPLLAD